jgi:hypothetical protein
MFAAQNFISSRLLHVRRVNLRKTICYCQARGARRVEISTFEANQKTNFCCFPKRIELIAARECGWIAVSSGRSSNNKRDKFFVLTFELDKWLLITSAVHFGDKKRFFLQRNESWQPKKIVFVWKFHLLKSQWKFVAKFNLFLKSENEFLKSWIPGFWTS